MTQETQDPSFSNQKVSLVLWWRQFKQKQGWKKFVPEKTRGIFGVPLQVSLRYANVAISFIDSTGNLSIYGYIPVVVAKCGAFLKENGKEVEGIFRLNGSAKRCKELQAIFDSHPKYGRNLEWDNFTVHDAACILRRYLNHLPEPIIPYKFYNAFRKPLKSKSYGEDVILIYKKLISSLPLINQQLLLYILDLLAVFASKSEKNLMTVSNLSSIFQPGILSHPEHDMSPKDYYFSQNVVIFLINHQDHFLTDTAGVDSAMLMPPTNYENNDFSETSSTIDSVKFIVKKKSNILKNASYGSLKFQSPCRNKHSKSLEFNLRNSFRFLLRSNTLPNKSTIKEIDHSFSETSHSSKKSNTLKIAKFSSWKLSTEESKIFKVKRRSDSSNHGISSENIFIDSTPKTSKNTKSTHTFSSPLINVSRLSRRFQKKVLDKKIPMNFSSSWKTHRIYSNTSPRKLKLSRSFSSQSTHSVYFSRANSIPSSITSEDRLSRDGSIFINRVVKNASSIDNRYI